MTEQEQLFAIRLAGGITQAICAAILHAGPDWTPTREGETPRSAAEVIVAEAFGDNNVYD
jgi:hypothetical protein